MEWEKLRIFLVKRIQCIAGEDGVKMEWKKLKSIFCENFWSLAFGV